MRRVYNFNPGPAALPLPVLERVQAELLEYPGSGMSILEMSHRSSAYAQLQRQAIADLRTLLGISDDYAVVFMGGGAQTQFALIPLNLLPVGAYAHYVVTGVWSATALREAQKLGDARELWSSAATGYDRVPGPEELQLDEDAVYLHLTSNNTVVGTQFSDFPQPDAVPLVCDMSSDLLSRPLEVSRFGLIYACAQKNLGPAGVTVVIIHQELIERCRARLPGTLSYIQMAAKNSLLNTPPVFAIYVLGLVLRHTLDAGGLGVVAARNAEKARRLYDTLDASGGFYRGYARPASRSQMNVTFRLPSPDLEARFVEQAEHAGLVGLKGHRSLGGIRASLYNAVSLQAVETLVGFMHEFRQRWG